MRDDNDLVGHVDYLHYNPVKHGLASCVEEWPHSSLRRYVRQGVLHEDWTGETGDAIKEKYGEPF